LGLIYDPCILINKYKIVFNKYKLYYLSFLKQEFFHPKNIVDKYFFHKIIKFNIIVKDLCSYKFSKFYHYILKQKLYVNFNWIQD